MAIDESAIRKALGGVEGLRISAAGRQDQVWRVRQNGAETVLKVIPKGPG
jgi:hypothetical protein